MSGATPTLEVLAARAVAGEGEALSTLCRRLEGPVFRLCLRLLGDVRDAEDAAQDVLVKVVTNLGSFEGRSALTTWVHQVAVRHVLGVKQSRAERQVVSADELGAMIDAGLAYGRTQPPPSPEERVLSREVRLTCTQGMLLTLTREERLALVLVDLLGFDAAEASEACEVSHAALRQRLSRARGRLAEFLQGRCGVANEAAACRCEAQIPAKQAMGLTVAGQRYSALVEGDGPEGRDAQVATAELAAVRRISAAFHRDGLFAAPPTLRARLEAMLPTVLRA